ncbi:MAG: polymer-forming cytoskeletal protein [Pseudomonadota bacterium]|jgi:cytoskeletal protein CcmA (bactofilin family)
MFFGNKKVKPQNRIDSLIGHGTKIEGNVSFAGGLRVDGYIKGNVTSSDGQAATLVLSEQGQIEGAIHVSHVVINGEVVGPVYATEYVELQTKSRVTGDVFYKTLEMHVGAIVEGKLVHQEGDVEPRPVKEAGLEAAS